MNVYFRGMTKKKTDICIFVVLLGICIISNHTFLHAQPALTRSAHSGEIRNQINQLGSFVSVLYVAAHPDDENTRMLTWLSRYKGFQTAYLSLTRGDGGQNLIGSEQGIELGCIRTQELLEARHRDGAEQYFSSAYDFGFSKNPEETFSVWNRNKIMEETVWLIRTLKPDIIITRFSPDPSATHGHHTASAQIALEAFEAAADPEKFPEQLRETDIWKATRILWNTSWFFYGTKEYDKTGLLKLDLGNYLPLLGQSVGEIAAESRSCHRSQGFGSARQRGEELEYFKHLAGDPVSLTEKNQDLAEGIETGWSRLSGAQNAEAVHKKIQALWNPEKPQESVPLLLELRRELKKLPPSYWRNNKLKKTEDIIAACNGLFAEALLQQNKIIPGDSVKGKIELITRSEYPLRIGRIFRNREVIAENIPMEYNKIKTILCDFIAPYDLEITHPFWAEKEPEKGMLQAGSPENAVRPRSALPIRFFAELFIGNEADPISVEIPLVYKYTDPENGELYTPISIVPEISVTPKKELILLKKNETKSATLTLFSHSAREKKGILTFDLSGNLSVIPESAEVTLKGKNAELDFTFQIKGDSGTLKPKFILNDDPFTRSFKKIKYPHIPEIILQNKAHIEVKSAHVMHNPDLRIGYLSGAGDEVYNILCEIGYKPKLLTPEDLKPEIMNKLDVIVMGVRAYNTNASLNLKRKELMDFIYNGGRLAVQYNTSGNLVADPTGPYPFKISRNRITEEQAELEITKPDHFIFHHPNPISKKDFNGWVQERGLYFLSEVAKEYTDLLQGNDHGEEKRKGMLVHTPYGKGHYFYTALSFFRQLPYGHEGAIKLFVNMLEGKPEKEKNRKP